MCLGNGAIHITKGNLQTRTVVFRSCLVDFPLVNVNIYVAFGAFSWKIFDKIVFYSCLSCYSFMLFIPYFA